MKSVKLVGLSGSIGKTKGFMERAKMAFGGNKRAKL